MRIFKEIKNFYAYENEWKIWSERDKLNWTIIAIIIVILRIILI